MATPAMRANSRTASGKVSLSWRMMKAKASPPTPQPKHLKMPLRGLTLKDGVFSAWKGQSPFQFSPAGLNRTTRPISSTMSRLARIWSQTPR